MFRSRRSDPITAAALPTALALLCLLAGGAAAATMELTGPAGLNVALDGRDLGPLPLAGPLVLAPGNHVVTAEARGYKPFREMVHLAGERTRLHVHVRMTRYSRKTALTSNLLGAGLGQMYLGKKTRGWVYLIAEAGGLLTALGAELQRSNYRDDYLLLQARYDSALISEDIASLRTATEQAYQDMQDMEKLRDTGLLVAGGAIVLSLLDSLIFFPSAVDLGPGTVPPTTARCEGSAAPAGIDFATVHAGIKLAF